MDMQGLHGIRHWERVRQNGLEIVKATEGANQEVVELFAYLHDCCRVNEGGDPGHGELAAEFAATLRGKSIHLNDEDFENLYMACKFHTSGYTEADVTVMACWDSDRLDLGRCNIKPNPRFLCTEFAKKKSTIDKAYKRSRGQK
ncbi:hypothetical protein [Rubellicoccus peritrichatus]|uniref:HD domain-containing protein n=1 Tax=Rubellicoccus peritrichatus TaxID=3080537 RepID=A0AAQ3LDQ3_9BACT|nr:hypothetical protein [Puniceicoccus sp. CR14]WOO41668.1 hypothetical protein RZN69_01110 [Puniceicoccus sp. CR14]